MLADTAISHVRSPVVADNRAGMGTLLGLEMLFRAPGGAAIFETAARSPSGTRRAWFAPVTEATYAAM
jgi:hypothetical protein